MKNLMMTLIFSLVAQVTFAEVIELRTGDKIKCYDHIAVVTYQIKVIDNGDEEAEITVKNAFGKVVERIISKDIEFDQHSEGASFVLVNYKSNYFVGLNIGQKIHNKVFQSEAYDKGNSRAIQCALK